MFHHKINGLGKRLDYLNVRYEKLLSKINKKEEMLDDIVREYKPFLEAIKREGIKIGKCETIYEKIYNIGKRVISEMEEERNAADEL